MSDQGTSWFRIAAAVALTAAVALAAACGPAAEPAEAPAEPPRPSPTRREIKPSAQDQCRALCDRSEACGGTSPDCIASCLERTGAQPAHQRGAYLWRLVSCLEAIDCSVIAADQAVQACGQAARSQLDVTTTLRKFCFESTRRAAACGKKTDQSQCLDEFRALDEESLQQGQACLAKPCDQVPACFQQAFGM